MMKSNETRSFWKNIFSIEPIDFYGVQIAIIFLLTLSIGFMLTVYNLDERLKKIEMNNNFNTIIKFNDVKAFSTNNKYHIITKVEIIKNYQNITNIMLISNIHFHK